MTLRRILCVLILEVCLNCSMASDLKSNPHIDNWMIESYKSCLKAQAELGNIMIDVSTGGVEDNLIDRYAVRFSFFPDMPVFFVSVKLLKPYPDGAGFFCRLNMKNNAVIYHCCPTNFQNSTRACCGLGGLGLGGPELNSSIMGLRSNRLS